MRMFSLVRDFVPRTSAALVAAAACTGVWTADAHSQRVAADAAATTAAEPKRVYTGGGARGTPRMYISDSDAFARKWKKFAADGLDKLLVIADFDHTLTPYYKPNGEQASSSHGVLMTSNVLQPQLAASERELFARFYPIEVAPTLSAAEKLPHMIAWWTQAHALLVESRVTRSQIHAAVAQSDLCFRRGTQALLDLLANHDVPVLVFSAGLYDVIHAALDAAFDKHTTLANVHVVANMMRFDATSEEVVAFDGALIHSLNKNARAVRNSKFWTQCDLEQRRNVLLLGDSRGDVHMADGLVFGDSEACEVVRIGFLNTHVDDALEEYLALYDVVLTHDASVEPVEMLLQLIQSQSETSSNNSPSGVLKT